MNDETIISLLERLSTRCEAIESTLDELLGRFDGQQGREYYTVNEAAEAMGRAPYTVREWCRLGRLNASKALSGRGIDGEWRISKEEMQRWRREGLLPVVRPYRHVS
jgi:hypothetical protein